MASQVGKEGAARPPYPFVEFEVIRDEPEVLDLMVKVGLSREDAVSLADLLGLQIKDDMVQAERKRVVLLLRQQIDDLDRQLPDAHGGKFVKQFAANALRGLIVKIRSGEEPRGQD